MAQILKLVTHNRIPSYRLILQCLDDLLEITRTGIGNIDDQRIEMINYWLWNGTLTEDECQALLDYLGIEWSSE